MATVNTNIRYPQSPFLDPTTQRPAREWIQWLQFPDLVGANISNAIGVASGGTGTSTIPSNGQLLIGNGTGYTVNSPTAGTGIGIVAGAGTLQFNNTGVTSVIAGTGISASSPTGAVTIANTGVLSFSGGTTGLTPSTSTIGAVTLAGTLNVANGGTGASTLTGYVYGNGTSAMTASTTIPYTAISGGLSVTITTAKLTTLGTNGSMTFTNGILTAQTAAT